jgi:DNA-binding transcriptional ArsR family regulator
MDEVILEKDKIKALSSDTRMLILKKLSSRRYTTSELSNLLQISKPTVKEHLSVLKNSSLIKQIPSENIWKYYELTTEGKKLVNPSGVKVLFMFVFSLFIATILGTNLFLSTAPDDFTMNKTIGEELQYTMQSPVETTSQTDIESSSDDSVGSYVEPIELIEPSPINYNLILFILFVLMTLVLLALYIYKKRKSRI